MVSSLPQVSIVLPTFNREQELPRAIDSVLLQTFSDFELIVVDDASSDRTRELVLGLGLEEPRIRYIRHPDNRGGAAARNTGIAAARAQRIAFQDSDDEWLPEKLALQLERLDGCADRAGGIYSAYERVLPDGRTVRFPGPEVDRPEGEIHRALLMGNFVGTPTLVLTRACLDRVGQFDERLPRLQDWELMLRVSRSFHVLYHDGVLVRAHLATDNITSGHDEALLSAETRIVNEHREWFAEAGSDVLAYRYWHLAHLAFMLGRMSAGRSRLLEAMAVRPFSRSALFLPLSFSAALYRRLYALRPSSDAP